MKKEEIATLVKYRLEQAQITLADARFLLDGNRSPQSIVNRSYYAMFYAALALMQNIGRCHPSTLASSAFSIRNS